MNTAIQTFTSEKFGQLRTVEVNGETYFVGKDVANALGYANTKNAIAAHVYDDDKTTALIQGTGSNYKSKAVIINESGLFALILGSKLKQAQEFKHWITSEVLPTIRKTGSYTIVSENSNAALVTITPSMAAEMLKGNIGNRKLNQAAINRIATDMLMGNYVVNGTTIKVYKDGTLADGSMSYHPTIHHCNYDESRQRLSFWINENMYCDSFSKNPKEVLRANRDRLKTELSAIYNRLEKYKGGRNI